MSTPGAGNLLQTKLGRLPGINAYEFMEGDDGKYTADFWVPCLARMQTPIAGWRFWELRTHDYDPADHFSERVLRSVTFSSGIKDRAVDYCLDFSDAFRKGIRPETVKSFVMSEELISVATGQLAQSVFETAEATAGYTPPNVNDFIHRLRTGYDGDSAPYQRFWSGLDDFFSYGISLGFVDAERSAQPDLDTGAKALPQEHLPHERW